jgi:hemerythrin-like domain-containing protein
MKSTSLLHEDHGHIRRALSILEQISERALHGERIPNDDIVSVVAFLQLFAGHHHHGKEEQVFFPALLSRGQASHHREVCAFIFNHSHERFLMTGIEHRAQTHEEAVQFSEHAQRLILVLRNHLEQEEQIVFPLADEALSDSDDYAITMELRNYERLWQRKELTRLLEELNQLSSKYLTVATSMPRRGACA